MKCVILAGGLGTRLSEETQSIPKPMIEIAGKPILHHIMDIFIGQGVSEFIVCGGYKWNNIVGYFYALNPKIINNNRNNEILFDFENFAVEVVNTGLDTQTGGRLRRIKHKLTETFLMTYGDGLANVNIQDLLSIHRQNHGFCTLTAVHPLGRFGRVQMLNDGLVMEFGEKIESEKDWINGGFMAVNPPALELIEDDSVNWEKEILPILSQERKLYARKHVGFWQCVDTQRDLFEIKKVYEEQGEIWLKVR